MFHDILRAPPVPSPYSGNATTVTTNSTESSTTSSSDSSLTTGDTNFGVVSLISDAGVDISGCDLTVEEQNWLVMAKEYTSTEKPYHEPKGFRVVRKLRIWHPKRSINWSFLRRLYNGRQDIKEKPMEDAKKVEKK